MPVCAASPTTKPPLDNMPLRMAMSELASTLETSGSLGVTRIVLVALFRFMALLKVTVSVAEVEPKSSLLPVGTKLLLPQVSAALLLSPTSRAPPFPAKPPSPVHWVRVLVIPRKRFSNPFDCNTPPAKLILLLTEIPVPFCACKTPSVSIFVCPV